MLAPQTYSTLKVAGVFRRRSRDYVAKDYMEESVFQLDSNTLVTGAGREEGACLAATPEEIHVLIVEPDPDDAAAMVAALTDRRDQSNDHHRRRAADSIVLGETLHLRAENIQVVQSIKALLEHDHTAYRLVICAMEHADGTGMDALAYLRNAQPELGVLLYGRVMDEALMREAIVGGAVDFVERDEHFLRLLPRHLMSAIARLDAQEHARRMKYRLHQSLGAMTDELSRLQSRIDHLETLSVTDELTGLYNRRYMNSALDDFWSRARHDDLVLGCMVIDIDHFKELNDRFGHQSGDAALYVLSEVLRDNCRTSDVITRYGGDEFCVLMPDITLEVAVEIARRIDSAFRRASAALLQNQFDLGLSIGVSMTSQSKPHSAMQLIAHADEAMYTAKREGHAVRARVGTGVIAA